MIRSAFFDTLEGLKRADLWLFLGWHDVKQRYRRSTLGPFWITLATLLFVGAMTLVYSGLFRQDIRTFLPLAACGIVVWTFISGCISEGCNLFITASATIKQVPAPLPVHAFRLVWTQLIYFLHNMVVVVLALAFAGVSFQPSTLLVLPALALLVLNLGWMALTLGTLSARFRDLPLIVQALITGLFMATPVLWQISFLPPERQWVAYINPFTYLVEIVRLPLLGVAPSLSLWLTVLAMALGGWAIAMIIFGRARTRLAYWV
jgi:ABC-2 type transport system permease protein/lipopolysaccharide transport system permease protein